MFMILNVHIGVSILGICAKLAIKKNDYVHFYNILLNKRIIFSFLLFVKVFGKMNTLLFWLFFLKVYELKIIAWFSLETL